MAKTATLASAFLSLDREFRSTRLIATAEAPHSTLEHRVDVLYGANSVYLQNENAKTHSKIPLSFSRLAYWPSYFAPKRSRSTPGQSRACIKSRSSNPRI